MSRPWQLAGALLLGLAAGAALGVAPGDAQDRGGPRRDHDHCTLGPGWGGLNGLHYHDGDACVMCVCCEVCGADGPVDHWHPDSETIQLGAPGDMVVIGSSGEPLQLAPADDVLVVWPDDAQLAYVEVARTLLLEDVDGRLWAACPACPGSPAAQQPDRAGPPCGTCQGLGLVSLPERAR